MNRLSYQSRWEFVEPYVRGKSVLDIGPTELMGTTNKEKLNRAIFPRVAAVARRVVGLEENAEQAQAFRDLGYDVRDGDAEAFDLDAAFEVVLAGELIEHLSNPGRFLDCVKRHLASEGVLILTTPNRFSLADFLSALRSNRLPSYDKPIAKHTAYYDEHCLLDLLRRHEFSKFTVAYYEWVGKPQSHMTTRILLAWLRRRRIQFLPGLMVAAGQ